VVRSLRTTKPTSTIIHLHLHPLISRTLSSSSLSLSPRSTIEISDVNPPNSPDQSRQPPATCSSAAAASHRRLEPPPVLAFSLSPVSSCVSFIWPGPSSTLPIFRLEFPHPSTFSLP
jgi:hypothetical protein